jgi:RHS repeat-associated protein
MGKVTALMMDVITEKSGHTIVPNAVSVCLTPCAPSPVPIPYPVVGNAVEGITDPPMRTKVEGQKFATTGSVIKTCHGNEPGTLKETCSLNTAGPCFIIMGAPIVLAELGMMGITGALCISNKAITVGAGGSASGAGGAGGPGGGGGGAGAGGAGPSGPSGPSNGGGGGGGSNSGASASAASPGARGSGADAAPGTSSGPPGQHQCQNGHPVDMATGHVVDEAVDLEIAGLIPFVFKRYYSSSRRNDVRATLGPGWAHNWEMAVWEEGKVTVLRDAQGRSIFFEQIPVGGSTFHRGERMELKRLTADRWEIFHLETRWTYRFESFEAGGQAALRHVGDAWDNKIELLHESGRLTAIVDTAGREIHVSWQGQRLTRLDVRASGQSEQTVDYLYDEATCLAAVTDVLGHSETFEYDAQRRMVATTLKTGVTFRYEYEADTGRCSRTWGPKGLYDLTFTADLENGRSTASGEEPRVYTLDERGHVTREALPSGVVLEERAYDEDGYLIAKTNGAGEGTKYWYDARGSLVREVDAEGAATVFERNELGLITKETTVDGQVTVHHYDAKGALTRTIEPTGQQLVFSYDDRGRLVRKDSASGTIASYEYDGLHNCVAETLWGSRSTYAHDSLGRTVLRKDALGRTERLVRDRLGRPTNMILADGGNVRLQYDALGNLIEEVDPLGGVTAISRVGMGKISRVRDPDGGVWKVDYTSNERIKRITNPRGESFEYGFDEAGRVVSEKTFEGREIRYERDAAGRVATIKLPEGFRRFTYDRCGRVLTDEADDGSVVAFRRDRLGRVLEARLSGPHGARSTRFERDAFGEVTREIQDDAVVAFERQTDGRVTGRTLPNGTRTDYAYGPSGELVGCAHDGHAFEISNDLARRPAVVADASGRFRLQTAYDPCDRIIDQALSLAEGGTAFRRTYHYDRNGRVGRALDERWGGTDYRYDALGRLLGASTGLPGARSSAAFEYDAAGSLVQALRGVSSGARSAWKVGPGNVLLETPAAKYVHDRRGRRIGVRDLTKPDEIGAVTQYRWDARDRLVEAHLPDGRRVVYDYDAFGRRVEKRVFARGGSMPERSVRYVWSGNVLAMEAEKSGPVRTFVHRPGSFELLLQQERGEVFLCVTDQVGVVRELIDRAGRVAWSGRFDPWGRLEEEHSDPARVNAERTVSSPFRLLGQVWDEETGLAWTHFRVFDPATGRWLSPDPLGIRGGPNLFAFDGSPTVSVDPFGLSTDDPHSHDAEEGADEPVSAAERRRRSEAQQALRSNREFRDWFHREYKRTEGIGSGDRHNPDLSDSQVADAYDEWQTSGGGGGRGRSRGGRGGRGRGGRGGGGDDW